MADENGNVQGNQAQPVKAVDPAKPVEVAPKVAPIPVEAAPAAKPAMPVAEEKKPVPEKLTPGSKSTGEETPGPAPVAAAPAAKTDDGKNVFTELFGDDKSQKNAQMMGSVVKNQDKKKKSLFGKGGSKLRKLKGKSKEPFKISKSTPGKLVLQVSAIVLIGVVGFFYTQNSPNFELLGANIAKQAEIAQDTLDQENFEIAVQKYLSATLLLDQYLNVADGYLYNMSQAESEYTSHNKKENYEAEAEADLPELSELIERIQGYLADEMASEDRNSAKGVVDDLIEELKAKSGEVDENALLQDIQDLESAKKLMQSKDFRDELKAINADDISTEDIEMVYAGYSEISATITSLINSIKDGRIIWSDYFEELEDLTKDVDPLFNTEFEGNLRLDDVKFSTNGTVSISGASITDDTKNFTLVSNLIDAYEASDLFENVEDRSYSKSEDDEDSYSGNFRISMDLEGFIELTDSENE